MLVVVGLVVAFVLVAWVHWRRGPAVKCRWRADRRRDARGMAFWHCAFCGAETFTGGGKPPILCQKETSL